MSSFWAVIKIIVGERGPLKSKFGVVDFTNELYLVDTSALVIVSLWLIASGAKLSV